MVHTMRTIWNAVTTGAPSPKALAITPISAMPPGAKATKVVMSGNPAPQLISHPMDRQAARIPKVTIAAQANTRGAREKNERVMFCPSAQPIITCAAISIVSGKRPPQDMTSPKPPTNRGPSSHGLGTFRRFIARASIAAAIDSSKRWGSGTTPPPTSPSHGGGAQHQASNVTRLVTKMIRTAWAQATLAPSAPARWACSAISEDAPRATA